MCSGRRDAAPRGPRGGCARRRSTGRRASWCRAHQSRPACSPRGTTCQARAGRRRHHTRHRDLGVGPRIGQEVGAGVFEGEPVGPAGDGLAAEQAQDDFEHVHNAVALGHRIDAEHHRVRVQEPVAGAEHDPAHPRFREGHVVELDDAVRDISGLRSGTGTTPVPSLIRRGCARPARGAAARVTIRRRPTSRSITGPDRNRLGGPPC